MLWALGLIAVLGSAEAPVRIIDVSEASTEELRGRLVGELSAQGIAMSETSETMPLHAPWVRLDSPTRVTVAVPSDDSSAPSLFTIEATGEEPGEAAAVLAVRVTELLEAWRLGRDSRDTPREASAHERAVEAPDVPDREAPDPPEPVPFSLEGGALLVVVPWTAPMLAGRFGVVLGRRGGFEGRLSAVLPFSATSLETTTPASVWWGSLRLGLERSFQLNEAVDLGAGAWVGLRYLRGGGASEDPTRNREADGVGTTLGAVGRLRFRPLSTARHLSLAIEAAGLGEIPEPVLVVDTERVTLSPGSLEVGLVLGVEL